MQQAEDFRAESRALAAVMEPLSDADFDMPTLFKGWTIDDVVGHLHHINAAAEATLEGRFESFFAPATAVLARGGSLREAQYVWLAGLRGRALCDAWATGAERVADLYAAADPKARVKWAGPDMSALSAITARQMETWAHGQEVFDALGAERTETDRIRNIAHLGVATFGWTFVVRSLPVPDPAPHVRLTAPSGAVWEWNAPQEDNRVDGSAVDFARVVTQVRNVADTALQATGETARTWLANAQCFAGPPEEPPAPGSRYRVTA